MSQKIKEHVLEQILKLRYVYHIDTYLDEVCVNGNDDYNKWRYEKINQFKILYKTGNKKNQRVILTAFDFLNMHFTWATLKSPTLNSLWVGHHKATVRDIELMQKLYICENEFTEVPPLDILGIKYA